MPKEGLVPQFRGIFIMILSVYFTGESIRKIRRVCNIMNCHFLSEGMFECNPKKNHEEEKISIVPCFERNCEGTYL